MTSDKRWENLPSMESLKITEKFLQSETGQKIEKERQEREEHINLARNVQASFLTSVQKQHTEEIARQEKELILQEEGNAEAKKQTKLAEEAIVVAQQSRQIAEQSLDVSKNTRWLTVIALLLAGVGIVISVFSLWRSACP